MRSHAVPLAEFGEGFPEFGVWFVALGLQPLQGVLEMISNRVGIDF
jgi:hypothetical protein